MHRNKSAKSYIHLHTVITRYFIARSNYVNLINVKYYYNCMPFSVKENEDIGRTLA